VSQEKRVRFWQDNVQRDLALVPLQSNPEFKKLQNRYLAPGR
jgi:hypothetical protein